MYFIISNKKPNASIKDCERIKRRLTGYDDASHESDDDNVPTTLDIMVVNNYPTEIIYITSRLGFI